MKDKICLITGATAGIGKATALQLASMGATVIGVGRNPARCESAAAHIRRVTGNHNVEFALADLSSQKQIRALAANLLEKYPRLDVLINNAGAFHLTRQLSVDGIEMTFALNHLGYFLLTALLLDLLWQSAPARIVNVSSAAHYSGRLALDDLQLTRNYSGWQAYANSKLANVLFTFELARRLEGTGVTANALHPGWVATGFAHNNFRGLLWPIRPFYWLFQKLTALTPEQGADTIVYLAASPALEGITGKFFIHRRETRAAAAAYDLETARRLWQLSEAMTGVSAASPTEKTR